MPRPIEALIHHDALAHNLQRARAAAPEAKVWAVVKANAYGHGIERVYPALRGADGFALLDIAEAQRLRALDWRGPILLLEGCFEARDLEACSRLRLWHTVHCEEQLEWLAAHKTQQPHTIFLKMNSGMNRLGIPAAAYRGAWVRANALPQVEDVVLMTHFADADCDPAAEADPASPVRGIGRQLATFAATTADLPGERSLANSAATLREALPADWVRPGIMLYGASPDHPVHDSAHWDLQPAMTLQADVIAVQQLAVGDAVGYGHTFVADRPLRLGVVACGYADGYPRVAPNGTPVLIDGVRCRLIGRVSMDLITVDLSPVPEAGVGSRATLWGVGETSDGEAVVLPVDEVAHAAGTNAYELVCALAPRVPTRVA